MAGPARGRPRLSRARALPTLTELPQSRVPKSKRDDNPVSPGV